MVASVLPDLDQMVARCARRPPSSFSAQSWHFFGPHFSMPTKASFSFESWLASMVASAKSSVRFDSLAVVADGETWPTSTVSASTAPAASSSKHSRRSMVSLARRYGTCAGASAWRSALRRRARRHSFTQASDVLISRASLRRCGEWPAAPPCRRSLPARSTKRSRPAAPAPVGRSSQMAWDRDDCALRSVAAVARSAFAEARRASKSATSATVTVSRPWTTTSPSPSVRSLTSWRSLRRS
mmetsp:Transcript_32209/g.108453  ORF Transcript_32209/g.108453 Transcript_32209/m.108453 type:complete len:241 (-) Transcript_32209:485-1207(-)